MFGREAAKLLDYVECFPYGLKRGISMINACQEAKLEGFPTWVINGEVSKNLLHARKIFCNLYKRHQSFTRSIRK